MKPIPRCCAGRVRDLFASTDEPRLLPIREAEIYYLPDVRLTESESLLRRLMDETPWRAEEVTVWGKRQVQPRLTAWYGDAGSRYRYSGIDLEPLPWTPTLQRIRRAMELKVDTSFNSVLLNYYRNHRDSMGFHSDNEPELGKEPVIASLSFGETRTLILKHRRRKDIERIKLPLASGSLLLMKGETQRNWHHGIAKQCRPCGARVNLTFRRILTAVTATGPERQSAGDHHSMR